MRQIKPAKVFLYTAIVFLVVVLLFIGTQTTLKANTPLQTEVASIKSVDSTISADGTVTAQNQATLHFQTAGKLILLPFKKGDPVSAGQVIAQLDTYALQRQFSQALNTYRSTRDTFDQAQQNASNNVLKNQESPLLPAPTGDKDSVINDAVKRIVDQNQANLDNSVINVELANYAIQLATLTSPLNGIITNEDVTVPYVNVTPTTTFTVADPDTLVFRANVDANDIDYIAEGNSAVVSLDGNNFKINGTVAKIYPSKVTLPSGEAVYQVDIQSDEIVANGKFDQTGSAIIMTNSQDVMLVPSWTVLGGNMIWVEDNGQPTLKKITTGKTHGDQTEVIRGLLPSDKVITDPKAIPAKEYSIL